MAERSLPSLSRAGRALVVGLLVAVACGSAEAACPGPEVGCRRAAKNTLLLKHPAGDRDRLIWKWLKGDETPIGALGDPTAGTVYTLCIYAGTGAAILEAELAAGAPPWSAAGASGFTYRDPDGSAAGIQKGRLRAGTAGRAKALVKGRGAALPDPPVGPLPLPVTVQLGSDGGLCLESVFGPADVVANQAEQFRAAGDAVSCGDNVAESGEACDGSDSVACPGACLSSCACGVPCADSGPACAGACPPGQSCGVDAPCLCGPANPAPCGGSAPLCNGACPSGETCAANPLVGDCGCVPEGAVPCANSLGGMPACGGACPSGSTCQSVPGPYCVCL